MLAKLFKNTPNKISVQVFRYILAGTAAYILDYGALIALTETFKVYYLTSAAIAFTLGAILSYILNVAWVFSERTLDSKRLEFLIFILIGIAGLILNHYCILFFTEKVHLHYLASKLVASILVSAANFFARKYILFR